MRRSSKEQINDYIMRNLRKGYTSDSLKWALINQGYSRSIIEKSLEETQKEMAKEVPVFKEKPVINYEVLDQDNNLVPVSKHWWKRILGL